MAENTHKEWEGRGGAKFRLGMRECLCVCRLAGVDAFHWEPKGLASRPASDLPVAPTCHEASGKSFHSLDIKFLVSKMREIELTQGWQIVLPDVSILINSQLGVLGLDSVRKTSSIETGNMLSHHLS